MRKSEIIKKYKKDRNIQDNYKLDEDEMYLIEEIQKALKQGQTLPIDSVVGQSEQLPQIHGLIKCECGKVYDVDLEKNCPQCGN